MAQQPAGVQLLFWLCIAVLAHVLVALFGVLNRWLQVRPTPPLPALRLALLVSLFALGTIVLLDAAGRAAGWLQQQRRQRRQWVQAQRRGLPACQLAEQQPAADASSSADEEEAAASGKPGGAAEPAECCSIAADGSSSACLPAQPAGPPATAGGTAGGAAGPVQQLLQPQLQAQPSVGRADSFVERRLGAPLQPRAEMAMARGLSRRVRHAAEGRPRLVRAGALALITVSFSSASICQIIAPGFIDPALVQLVNMFTVLCVAAVQRVLLHHRLPLLIWPCAAVMLAGAGMVIVPAIGKGANAGLSGWRGWLGFGLSVLSMLSTVVYFVSLQAFRRLGFTSMQLQYCYLLFSVVVLLPLTLPINGVNWASQFASWHAGDWLVLAATGCLVCVGANFAIQHATWQLGAPTVSMFYGLRLVASILESKLILSTTVITSGVQIAGTVVTVAAVSVYMVQQWRLSKQQAAAAAGVPDKAAAAAAAGAAPLPLVLKGSCPAR